VTYSASLIGSLEIQAAACAAMGSPFSAAILTAAAADTAASGPVLALLEPWAASRTRSLITDAVPIRLLGALHELALSGDFPALTAAYPGPHRAGDPAAAWRAAREAMVDQHQRLAAFMTHEPQTNEVRRSACLLPGFLTVARETGLALRSFEIGASGGLNQLWDCYRYRLGDAGVWGEAGAPVLIDTEWRGSPPPLEAKVSVSERGACDRKPVNIADPAARSRLKAYIWADQIDRMARLDAAVSAALAGGIEVEKEDAVSWTPRRAAPVPGVATVLFHSVFWQYLPPESQAAMTAIIQALGAGATAEGPFAWLRMEPPPSNMAMMELRLTLWPGGEDRRLAIVHPHGAWVAWDS
jgi:hypothetical protein